MDEQRLQELNAIRDRMLQGMSGYQAINYNALPQNPVPFKQYSSFVNKQNEIETDHKLAKSFYNGGISMINGLIGAGRMLVDSRLEYEAQEGEAAGMAGVDSITIAEINKPTKLLERYNVQANTTAEKLIYGLAEGGTQLAGQALVTIATGGIGGGIFMGAQIAGNQYNELRDAGVDPDRAFKASVANAIIQTPLEQLSFGKIMKALPANSKLKAKLYSVLESALTEGFTEGLQSLPEQLTNIWAKNNGIDALGVAREWDKNASDNIKDMVYSGIIGSILGGGARGINVAINSKLEQAFVDYQNKSMQDSVENAKKNGISAQQAQNQIDMYNRGEVTVNLDAQEVLSYAQTQGEELSKVAESLGVTVDEIEDAASNGLDVTVSKGHMVQASMEHKGFQEALLPHVSYGDQGKSLNYYQMQEEMSKAYGEGSEVVKALDEELNTIEQSMLDAGVAKQQAKDARTLANAFAVSMAPENPAEFLKKYKLRFANEGKVKGNNGSLFQISYNADAINPTLITQVNSTENSKVDEIAASMEEKGYVGRPIVAMVNGDEYIGLTGSHRIAAAKKVGLDVDVITVENNDDTVRLLEARDDWELADIAEELYEDNKISEEAYSLLTGEKSYNQAKEGKIKGSFTPQADGSYVISMFKNGDASTVIHETGHYFFETFMQESGLDTASDKLKADRKAFLDYVGMTEEQWQAADFEGRRAAHERIATAFEQYLLEGKAPSRGLRGVFDRFSKWLKKIYGEVVQSPDYQEVPDNVRQAFDHWLAADMELEETARMQGFYGKLDNRLTANLSPEKKKWLEDKIYSAHQAAIDMLTKKYMRDFAPKRRAEIEAYRKEITPQIEELADTIKVNVAREKIRVLFSKDVNKTETVFAQVSADGKKRKVTVYKWVRLKTGEVVTVTADPATIASKYLHTIGTNYENPADRMQQLQQEIDARLQPIIDEIKRNIKEYNSYANYYEDVFSGEFDVDVGGLKEEVINPDTGKKLKPGERNEHYIYHNADMDLQDNWYARYVSVNGRKPLTKAQIREIAIEIYSGNDAFGLFGNIDAEYKLTAEEAAEIKHENDIRKKEITDMIETLQAYKKNKEYSRMAKVRALRDDERINFEFIAEWCGYSSGSEMAQDLINRPTRQQMINEMVQAQIKEKFPDYAQEKAQAELAIIEALNNDEQGEVIALEQQLIEEAAQTAFVEERSQQARMALAREQKAKAEIAARKTLLAMPMREALNIRKFAMAERRAAAKAKKALKEGNFEEASEYKRQQMIAHAMVRHSARLKQEVEKNKKFVKRLLKLKKDKEHFGNESNFNQIAHLLYRLGIERKDYNPNARTQNLQDYLNEMSDKLGEGVPDIDESVINEASDLRDQNMSIEQYEKISDAIHNLYAIVKQDIKGTLDAKAKDFEETKTNITDNLNKLEDKYTPSVGGVDTESFLARQIAQRQTLDNFLEMMDGWTFSYFSKTFGAPLKHAADLQAKLTMEFEDAVSAAMKKWLPTAEAHRAADTERYYKELGANANKHTLVNMLIQLGNEGNMRRLCTSRVVGAENSKLWVFPDANNNLTQDEAIALTRENILNFLSKNLTKADVEFAQAKVDAANKLWPLLAKVNVDTKGFAPAKVEATPVAFKPSDGDYMTFRGGYYPLARDSRLESKRQGAEAFSGTEDGSAPIKTMTTVQSTSKGRTGANYPVKLNYGYEMGIIQDTIHDIAYRQVMMNFNKIFSDQEIASLMKRKLGLENYNILKETLWKCARPRSLQDSVMAERSLTQAANWIRRKTVNAIIACNLKISLQNLGNVFLYGNTVDGFTQADVMAALPKIFSKLDRHKEMRAEVFAKSIFMRERAKAPDFAMKEVAEENAILKANKIAKGTVNKVTNKVTDTLTSLEEGAQTFGTRMLEVTDNITAVPIWLQAYNKKIQAGASEQEAIDFADTVIRRTLGSNRLQDVSSIQRGGPMYKLFTAFQSFFNTQFNQWYREANIDYKLYTKGEYKEAFMRVMSFALSKWIFACLANTIIGSLSFIKPFEKDEKKKWRDITQELITYPISMTGGVGGQVALAGMQALLGMQSYGYRLSIIENTLTKGISLGTKINAVADGRKDIDELYEPVAEITAIMLGLPLQFVRTPANLINIVSGDMNFELEDIMNRRRKSERNKRE